MHIRRWVPAILVVALVATLAGVAGPVFAQQVDKKLQKAQQEEVKALFKIADAAAAGQPGPADFTMSIAHDVLKAQENKMFVPFTVSIPADPTQPTALFAYIRVTAKTAAPAPAPADKKDEKKKDKKGEVEYAWEDAYPVDLKAPEANQPYRFSRAFSVVGGEYELMVILKERAPIEKKDKNAVYKTAVYKQTINIPNFWTAELTTSSVILTADVTQITEPLTPQQAKEQPYTMGSTKITPMMSSKLPKKGDLSVVFLIYNAQADPNKKPDVAVEYVFYQKVASEPNGEKFFNKTNPQNFNATTLPPQFDPGIHQLVAGQSVPLGSFPEGDFRLEIKVTDKLAGKTVTQNMPFTVVGS